MKKVLTLAIIHDHPHILLGMKKRGFGVGRWNGFGGKVHDGESIEAAARREMHEECGVSVRELVQHGLLQFRFASNPDDVLEVHVFRAVAFDGQLAESEEMRPQWFKVTDIPYAQMWPDDIHWLPLLLEGKKFHGKFLFGEGDTVLEKELHVIES